MTLDNAAIAALIPYIRRLSATRGHNSDMNDDIVSMTLLRLLEIEETLTQENLFYRAKLAFTDAAAEYYAGNVVLSGISPSAHHAATKYLRENDGDVEAAYRNQTGTARVSRQLIQAARRTYSYVSSGDASANFERIQGLMWSKTFKEQSYASVEQRGPDDDPHALSPEMMEYVSMLPERLYTVLSAVVGFDAAPIAVGTLAEQLGLSLDTVRIDYQRAIRLLKVIMTNENEDPLVQTIIRAMVYLGELQPAMSTRLGVNQRALSEWLSGSKSISAANRERIAPILAEIMYTHERSAGAVLA